MVRHIKPISTISCCKHCVPPKRHTACWDNCPDFDKEKAEYEAIKKRYSESRKAEEEIQSYQAATSYKRRGRR